MGRHSGLPLWMYRSDGVGIVLMFLATSGVHCSAIGNTDAAGENTNVESGDDTFTPVAWYRFEDAQDLGVDSSPGGLNLTIPNCTVGRAHFQLYLCVNCETSIAKRIPNKLN